MASFRTHVSFGIAFGILSAIGLVSFALVPDEWSLPIAVGLSAIVGAILPDMDSDTGLPFHVTFGSLALVGAGFGLLTALRLFPGDYVRIIGIPFGVFFGIWIVLGGMFKKFTVHRGMAHSIPAAGLAGLVVYSIAVRLGFVLWDAFLLGLAMTLGYLLHLVLDELNSAVNFHGTPFIPNKALGSALKLASGSASINTLVYMALLLLVLVNGKDILDSSLRFIAGISAQ